MKGIKSQFGRTDHKPRPRLGKSTWLFCCFLISALAGVLRFLWLDLRAMHHDEGVNGFFLTTLFREGIYKYDPSNYHGPDLYYFALAFSKIFGLNTTAIRSSVAIFGVLTVILVFFLRRYIGDTGSLFGASLVAISPGMVYFSRYFIHETSFVFFSLAFVISMLFFIEKRKAGVFSILWITLLFFVCFLPLPLSAASQMATEFYTKLSLQIFVIILVSLLILALVRFLNQWKSGTPIYFLLAAAASAFLFATKETAFITMGTMFIASFSIWIWEKITRRSNETSEYLEPSWKSFRSDFDTPLNSLLISLGFVIVFAYVGLLFFSSFFTNWGGISAAFEAYTFWTKTGTSDHAQNGSLAFVSWLWRAESPVLILFVFGAIIAFFRSRHRFAMFAALWAFGLLLAYSIIPYKTPWLALSFIAPMCLVAGYAINELAVSTRSWARYLAGIVAIAAVGIMAYQTIDQNFIRYDDNELPYVYAHTERGFLKLVDEIEHYAEKSGKEKEAKIEITSPEYWSLPWYLNDQKNANFRGEIGETRIDDDVDIVIASKAQTELIETQYPKRFRLVGEYPLRPGVRLHLLVKNELERK